MSVISSPLSVAESVRDQLKSGKRDAQGRSFSLLLQLSLALSILILLVLLYDVVTGGWSVLGTRLEDFLAAPMRSQAADSGVAQGIRGTFFIGLFTVVISFPMGVAAAIYLEEYGGKGRLARFIDINIRNLAGVPSVVYGILGLTIFVKAMGDFTGPNSNGRSVVAAGLTLAVLVLPIVIITAAEALRAVPQGLREAGYGVGATRWEVTRHHVLPYAAPGILTGTVLALARALGEAAPLILVGATTGFLTGGSSYQIGALTERFTALPIIIATWAGRPGDDWEAVTAAAIVVLLGVVLLANTAAILLRNRFEKTRK
ncbi:MAG TPA: phosphate ABC transporter permease PstA [Acidimicrobiales bacterium]